MKKKLALALIVPLLITVIVGCSSNKGDEVAYPDKPIQFIVPWSPGGGSDTAMRTVAKYAEKYLGEPLVVVNKPGVSGTIGLMDLAKKRANGYYIGMIHEGLIVAHHAGITEINYDTFKPVANMTDAPQWLVANIDAPYDTLDEFIEYSKAHSGEVTFGITLQGVAQAWGAVIAEDMGTELNLVPYEGTGKRIQALAGGFLNTTIADWASVNQFVENGDIKLLAYAGEERSKLTPDLPTLLEKDINLVASVRRGIVVPKETPEKIVNVLEKALEKIANDKEFIQDLKNQGIDTLFLGREAYKTYLDSVNTNTAKIADKLK
jgi:tripartite-type tricarboxylate transporter receptor subunit TctC